MKVWKQVLHYAGLVAGAIVTVDPSVLHQIFSIFPPDSKLIQLASLLVTSGIATNIYRHVVPDAKLCTGTSGVLMKQDGPNGNP